MQCTEKGMRLYSLQAVLLLLLLLVGFGSPIVAQGTEAAADDEQQRSVLEAIYQATQGQTWQIPQARPGAAPYQWLTTESYCRWFGVSCCRNNPLSVVDCVNGSSVVALNLEGFGLRGSIPQVVASLSELRVLNVGDNPGLRGVLPFIPSLLWLSVLNTSLEACQGDGQRPQPASLPASSCDPTPGLVLGNRSEGGTAAVECPPVLLRGFQDYSRELPPSLVDKLTSPFPQPSVAGAVLADPAFSNVYGCQCRGEYKLRVGDGGALTCEGEHHRRTKTGGWIAAIVVVAIVPQLLVALGIYVFIRHKAAIHALIRSKEQELQRKRGKVPGTPGVALQDGRGVLALADIMVTWVCTDVASSTRLWEWNPDCMDRSIDLHNREIRSLLDELGGHEIRNEGDSFVISFHDALDGIRFCLKAQERLMQLPWPQELKGHPSSADMYVGDLVSTTNPATAGTGALVMSGLRVRMGINTGVPDDVFLHDVTEHVDYRGLEYDLAGEICDLACGGQILIGPKTFQRWNKQESAQPDPLLGFGPVLPEMGGWREITQSFLNPSMKNRMGPASMSFRHTMLRRQLGQESTAASGNFAQITDWGAQAQHQASPDDNPSIIRGGGQRISSTSIPPVSPKHVGGRIRMSFSEKYGSYTEMQVGGNSPGGHSIQLPDLDAEQAGPSPRPYQQKRTVVRPPAPQVSLERGLPGAGSALGSETAGVVSTSGKLRPALRLSEGFRNTGLAMSKFFWSITNSGQQKEAARSARHASTSAPHLPGMDSLAGRLAADDQSHPAGTGPALGFYRAASDELPSPHAVGGHVGGATQDTTGNHTGNHISAGGRQSNRNVTFARESDWAEPGTADMLVQNALGHLNPLFQPRYQADRPEAPRSLANNVGSTWSQHDGVQGPTAASNAQMRNMNRLPTWENLGDKSALSLAPSMRKPSIMPTGNQAVDAHSPNALLVADSSASGGLEAFTGACSALLRQLLSRCLLCMHVATSGGAGGDDVWDADPQRTSGAAARSASSYKDAMSKGLVIDMGYWNWRQWQPAEQDVGQERIRHDALASKFVHLVQVVPSSLSPRALIFDWPLSRGQDRWEKISPGFFDAPGSSRLIFPGMRDVMTPAEVSSSRPVVCVAFSSVEGFREISALNMDMARDMLHLHNACVRETLSASNGYECKEFNGSFMTAFSDACAAVEWALTLQLALMHVAWARELMACHELAAEVWDEESHRVIFRGFRSRVGIYSGSIDRVTPHVKTGRADYFGQPVNRAARLMSAANGGQIVCDRALMEGVAEEWARRYGVRREIEEPYSVQQGTQSATLGQRTSSQTMANTPHERRLASLLAGTRTSSHEMESMHSVTAAMGAARAAGGSETATLTAAGLSGRQHVSERIRSDGVHSPFGSERLALRTADNSLSIPHDSRLARSFVGSSFTKLRLRAGLAQGSIGGGSFSGLDRSLQRTPHAGSTTTADSGAHAADMRQGSITSYPSARGQHEDLHASVLRIGRSQTAGGVLMVPTGGSSTIGAQLTTNAVQRLNELELRTPSAPALGPARGATIITGTTAVPASMQLQPWDPALRMRSTNRTRRNSSSSTASARSHHGLVLPPRTASNRSLRSTLSNPHSHTASSVHLRNHVTSPNSIPLSPHSMGGPLSPVLTLALPTPTGRGGLHHSASGISTGHHSPKSAKSMAGSAAGNAASGSPAGSGGGTATRSAAGLSAHTSEFGADVAATQPERHQPQPSRLSVPGLPGSSSIPADASFPNCTLEPHDEASERSSDPPRTSDPQHLERTPDPQHTSDVAHVSAHMPGHARTTAGTAEEDTTNILETMSNRPPTIRTVGSSNWRSSDMSTMYAQIPASPGVLTRNSTSTSHRDSNPTSGRIFKRDMNNSIGSNATNTTNLTNATSLTHTTHPMPVSRTLTTSNSRGSQGAASTGLTSSRSYQLMLNGSSGLQMPEHSQMDQPPTPHLTNAGSGRTAELLVSPRVGPGQHAPTPYGRRTSSHSDTQLTSAFAAMAHEPLPAGAPLVTPMEPMQPPSARAPHISASPRTRSGRLSLSDSRSTTQAGNSNGTVPEHLRAVPGAGPSMSVSVSQQELGNYGSSKQGAGIELTGKRPSQGQLTSLAHGIRAVQAGMPIPRLSAAVPDDVADTPAAGAWPPGEPGTEGPAARVVHDSPSQIFARLDSQPDDGSLKGTLSSSTATNTYPHSHNQDRRSPSLKHNLPTGASTSTLQHAQTAASLPHPQGQPSLTASQQQAAMRRMSLFIVGSDDQPMVIKYRGQSNNGGSLHTLLHGPLNASSGMLSLTREDNSADRSAAALPPGSPMATGATTSAAQQPVTLSSQPGSGRPRRGSAASYNPGGTLSSPSATSGGGAQGAGRASQWELGTGSLKERERTSNQHSESAGGMPNTPRGVSSMMSNLMRKRSVVKVDSGKGRPPSRGGREGAPGPSSTGTVAAAQGEGGLAGMEHTVMAECFKITPQTTTSGAEGSMGSGGPGGSITMIKYTNLKEQAQRAGEIEEELPPLEEDEPLLPTNTTIIPTVAVEVAVWSLGSYRLKGVTELMRVVQVLPVSLERRMDALQKGALNRGKARCIQRNVARVERIVIRLPDVTKLSSTSLMVDDEPPTMAMAPHVFGRGSTTLMEAYNSMGVRPDGPPTGPASSHTLHTASVAGGSVGSPSAAMAMGSPPAASIPLHLLLMQHHEEAVAQGLATPSSLAVPPALLSAPGASGPGMPMSLATGGLPVLQGTRSARTGATFNIDMGLGEEGLAPISESITPSHSMTSMRHGTSSYLATQRSQQARSTAHTTMTSYPHTSTSVNGDAPRRLSVVRPAELQLPISPDGASSLGAGSSADPRGFPMASSSASGYTGNFGTSQQQASSTYSAASRLNSVPGDSARSDADGGSTPRRTPARQSITEPASESAATPGSLPPMTALAFLTAVQESQAKRQDMPSSVGSPVPNSTSFGRHTTRTPSTSSIAHALGLTSGGLHADPSSPFYADHVSSSASSTRPTPASLGGLSGVGIGTPSPQAASQQPGSVGTMSPLGAPGPHLLPAAARVPVGDRHNRGSSSMPMPATGGRGLGGELQPRGSHARGGGGTSGDHGQMLDSFYRTSSHDQQGLASKGSIQVAGGGLPSRLSSEVGYEQVSTGHTSRTPSEAGAEGPAAVMASISRDADARAAAAALVRGLSSSAHAALDAEQFKVVHHTTTAAQNAAPQGMLTAATQLSPGSQQAATSSLAIQGGPQDGSQHPVSEAQVPHPPATGSSRTSPRATPNQLLAGSSSARGGSPRAVAATALRASAAGVPADSHPSSSVSIADSMNQSSGRGGRHNIQAMPTFGSGQLPAAAALRLLESGDTTGGSSTGLKESTTTIGGSSTGQHASPAGSALQASRMVSSGQVMSLSGAVMGPAAGAGGQPMETGVPECSTADGSVPQAANGLSFSLPLEAPELTASATDLLTFFMQAEQQEL